jgi:hypothetical protein
MNVDFSDYLWSVDSSSHRRLNKPERAIALNPTPPTEAALPVFQRQVSCGPFAFYGSRKVIIGPLPDLNHISMVYIRPR